MFDEQKSVVVAKSIDALHKVVLPVGAAVLVALHVHVLLCKQVIIRMVLLPLFLLPLLRLPCLFFFLQSHGISISSFFSLCRCHRPHVRAKRGQKTYLGLEGGVGSATEVPVAVVLFLLEVGLLDLGPGLGQAVDDGVLALGHEDAADEARVLERDLADVHGAVLFEVGPGRVDDGDVVFFVACGRCVMLADGFGGGGGGGYPRWSWPW